MEDLVSIAASGFLHILLTEAASSRLAAKQATSDSIQPSIVRLLKLAPELPGEEQRHDNHDDGTPKRGILERLTSAMEICEQAETNYCDANTCPDEHGPYRPNNNSFHPLKVIHRQVTNVGVNAAAGAALQK